VTAPKRCANSVITRADSARVLFFAGSALIPLDYDLIRRAPERSRAGELWQAPVDAMAALFSGMWK